MTLIMENSCSITGQLKSHPSQLSGKIYYEITYFGKQFEFTFCKKCYNKIPFEEIKHILRGLILNDRFPELNTKIIHWGKNEEDPIDIKTSIDLKNELESAFYPRTAKDKIENLVSFLYKKQKYDGDLVEVNLFLDYNYLFFKDHNELNFYLKTLVNIGDFESHSQGLGEPEQYNITYQGISNYIKTLSEGFNSNKCFVAMAFDDSMISVRGSIKNALKATKFEPIIIDEQNVDSDKTINDEIIANLRKCKFCIADFSLHRNGVYFESGFALGLGKQVIYLCSKDEFEKAHFDIRPLQHIIYTNPEEIEKKLIDKIEAWIV